mgnify:CR=1 FL=1
MKIAKLKWKHMILLVISTSSLQLRAEEETAAVGPVEASACEKNKDEVVLAADETLSSRADGWGLKWSGSEIAKSLQENNFNITDLSSDLSQLGLSGRVVDPSANNNIQLDCSKSKEEMSLAISEQWAKHRAQERIDLALNGTEELTKWEKDNSKASNSEHLTKLQPILKELQEIRSDNPEKYKTMDLSKDQYDALLMELTTDIYSETSAQLTRLRLGDKALVKAGPNWSEPIHDRILDLFQKDENYAEKYKGMDITKILKYVSDMAIRTIYNNEKNDKDDYSFWNLSRKVFASDSIKTTFQKVIDETRKKGPNDPPVPVSKPDEQKPPKGAVTTVSQPADAGSRPGSHEEHAAAGGAH